MKLYLATLFFTIIPIILSVISGFSKRKLLKTPGRLTASLIPLLVLLMAVYYRIAWTNGDLGRATTMWSGFFNVIGIIFYAGISTMPIFGICLHVQVSIIRWNHRRHRG